MSTLLEKAMSIPAPTRSRGAINGPLDQRLELAMAYIERRITGEQFCRALGKQRVVGSLIPNFISSTLSDAIRNGLLVRRSFAKVDDGEPKMEAANYI